MESALRKIIASAAAGPLFDLFCLLDGVTDPENYDGLWLGARIEPVPEDLDSDEPEGNFLHDEFYEVYWKWRDLRPNPGWVLDNLDEQLAEFDSSSNR